MSQGQPNPGFMQEKVKKMGFSKKTITRIEKLFLVPINPSNTWKGESGVASFLLSKNLWLQSIEPKPKIEVSVVPQVIGMFTLMEVQTTPIALKNTKDGLIWERDWNVSI